MRAPLPVFVALQLAAPLAAALTLTACATTTVVTLGTCDVSLDETAALEAAPGEPLVLTGTPMTTDWDTVVWMGDVQADVVQVERVGCTSCDGCREIEVCGACEDCDACDRLCEEQCVETVTVLVPDLPAGEVDAWIVNRHGRSAPIPVTVTGAEDTGPVGIETR